MNIDDVLFGLILCGIGLVGVFFRSEYRLLRQLRATERRYQHVMRELHLKRLSTQTDDLDREISADGTDIWVSDVVRSLRPDANDRERAKDLSRVTGR
jgi:hypothetical protein